MGETLQRVVSAVGFDTNDRNLRTLAFDSTELEMSREEFIKMWRVRSLQVRTFQESQGLAGVRGFSEKVSSLRLQLLVSSNAYSIRLFPTFLRRWTTHENATSIFRVTI
jgi:hypothetical protein